MSGSPSARLGTIAALVFDSVAIFDGESLSTNQRITVPIRGRDSQKLPDEEVIDGTGKTLLPGFIDAHVHIDFYDPKVVLAGGVTAARDLAWPLERILQLKDGPFLLFAGPMLTAVGGYPTRSSWAPPGTGREVRDAGEARAAVRDLARAGVSIIKVAQEPQEGPVLDASIVEAIVDEAHAAGLRVTSHVWSLDQLEIALDARVDELAHGLYSDETIPDETISRMVLQDVTYIPTLHINPSPQRMDNLRRFFAAGGRVIYGTDMGNTGPPPGIDVEELRLMTEAGIPPATVLASATSAAADYLGLPGRGRITEGSVADLILVEGNPLEDFGVLAKPVLVIGGRDSHFLSGTWKIL